MEYLNPVGHIVTGVSGMMLFWAILSWVENFTLLVRNLSMLNLMELSRHLKVGSKRKDQKERILWWSSLGP